MSTRQRPRIEGKITSGTCDLKAGVASITVEHPGDDGLGAEPITIDVPVEDFSRYRMGAAVWLELRLAPKGGE